jgi:hypothetical protein
MKRKALEVAKTSGEYQLAAARIHAMAANRPGEVKYRQISRHLSQTRPRSNVKFMAELEGVRAVQLQNVMSYEEAFKIVANDPMNAAKPLEEELLL